MSALKRASCDTPLLAPLPAVDLAVLGGGGGGVCGVRPGQIKREIYAEFV